MNLPVPVNSREGLSLYKLVLRCAIFTIIFCLISILTIFVTSLILYNTTNPTSKSELGGVVALYISTFITVFIMTKINKEKWLFGGLILGGLIFALTLLLFIFIHGDVAPNNFFFRLIILAISLISAFLGRKKEGKNRKFKHK